MRISDWSSDVCSSDLGTEQVTLSSDEGNRPSTTLESLSSLKPVFKDGQWNKQGQHITAGNASQLSDRAAVTVLMSGEQDKRRGLPPLGIYRGFAVAGCKPEEMGTGPVVSIPQLPDSNSIRVSATGIGELHDALDFKVVYYRYTP